MKRRRVVILIDGYNVLYKLFEGQDVGEDLGKYRRLTVEIIDGFETERQKWVVFDGRKSRKPRKRKIVGSVKIAYATPPQSADDVIVSLCHQYRKRIILVTSDKELLIRVRRLIRGFVPTGMFCEALVESKAC